VLIVLLLATAATATTAALGYISWWYVTIPATLTALFLLACARRVRRASDAYWEAAAPVAPVAGATTTTTTSAAPARAAESDAHPDDEPTVVLAREELSQIAVPVETSDGDVLWDPVPVTLPTYVSKPKARRTTRTIDLAQPGTWTSGNTEEASALVEQAAEQEAASQEAVEEPRRAVGS